MGRGGSSVPTLPYNDPRPLPLTVIIVDDPLNNKRPVKNHEYNLYI